MIILDDEDQQPSKLGSNVAGPTLRLPERVAGRLSTSLPDYETSQAQHTIVFRKSSFRRRFDSKFWHATFYALAIYIALSVIIGIPLIILRVFYTHGPSKSLVSLYVDDSSAPPPLTNDGILAVGSPLDCDQWDSTDDRASKGSVTASAHYNLSASGSISIRSNATFEMKGLTGALTADINSDTGEKRTVLSVTLRSSNLQLRQQTHICFSDSGDDRGLSIYVPSHISNTDSLSLDISLLFPRSSSTLGLSTFTTYLPMFSQHFGYLSPAITFNKVSIEGSGMEVLCKSIQASKVTVTNSLASISGTFNVSGSLKLDTVGGSISTNVTLVHEATDVPTFMFLDTGNSEIKANVTLVVPPVRSLLPPHPPKFFAHVKTFNGPISLHVAHDPMTPSTPLDLRVENNQAESNVTLDAKFSGNFDAKTKLAAVAFHRGAQDLAADPTGENRQQSFDIDQDTSTRVRGWVGWGERPTVWDPRSTGKVTIVSALSPIRLQLGPDVS